MDRGTIKKGTYKMLLDTTHSFREDKSCYFCGTTFNLHLHHIYFSANRKISDQNGFTTYLCQEHHTGRTGVHLNRDKDLILKRECEKWYLKNHTLEEFTQLIGRNYID